jgi:hypothetical protein
MRRLPLLFGALALFAAEPIRAATVWTGPFITFTQGQPEDTDVILPGEVAITRDAFRGIYNTARESQYFDTSPAGTEWAFPMNNPGETIVATRFADLNFAPWVDAHGRDPLGTLGQPAVLHLIESDLYLDIMFTEWGAFGAGGFAYERATVPEPSAAAMLGLGLIALSLSAR